MSQHSDRARRNMRKQINGAILLLKSLLANHKNELVKIKHYRKYKLPGQKQMERAATNRISKTKKDLRVKQLRKAKLAKEGKI